jgi:hypothetical protein
MIRPVTFDTAPLFDTAHSAISQVMRDGRAEPLNETETRTHLIDPLLYALGYRTLDSVRREYRLSASGQFVDYLLTAGTQKSCSRGEAIWLGVNR